MDECSHLLVSSKLLNCSCWHGFLTIFDEKLQTNAGTIMVESLVIFYSLGFKFCPFDCQMGIEAYLETFIYFRLLCF